MDFTTPFLAEESNSATSTTPSTPQNFHLFPRLPTELQIEIFTLHALSSVVDHDYRFKLLIPPGHETFIWRFIFAQNILSLLIEPYLTCGNPYADPEDLDYTTACEKIHLPPGLQVCRLARDDAVMDVFKRLRRAPLQNLRYDRRAPCQKEIILMDFRCSSQHRHSILNPLPRFPQELQGRVFILHALSSMSPYDNLLGPPGHLTRLHSGIPQKESQDLSLCIDDDNGRDPACYPVVESSSAGWTECLPSSERSNDGRA